MFINHCSNNVRKIGTSYITKIKKKSQRKISARIERKREKKEEERERERGNRTPVHPEASPRQV